MNATLIKKTGYVSKEAMHTEINTEHLVTGEKKNTEQNEIG